MKKYERCHTCSHRDEDRCPVIPQGLIREDGVPCTAYDGGLMHFRCSLESEKPNENNGDGSQTAME